MGRVDGVEARWEWDSGCCTRPANDYCPGSTIIRLDAGHLVYEGFCADVAFGGGYAIGSQNVGDFLARGPLVRGVPAAVAGEIRARVS